MSEPRRPAAALVAFAAALLERTGVRADIAGDVAAILVDGDLLGHTTHGLALLAPYLADVEQGRMTKTGARRANRNFARKSGLLTAWWMTLNTPLRTR